MSARNFEKTLFLVGHSIWDTIYDPKFEEPIRRWGGIHNVARHFREISWDKVVVEPAAFGEAKIIIDRQNSSKEVVANLNQESRVIKLQKADWMHVAYHNMLTKWQPYADFQGVISTDWCAGENRKLPDNVSYAFIASDEFSPQAESVWNPNAVFVAHCPEKVELWKNGQKLSSFPVSKIESINPLGCGDFFAASFIQNKLCDINDDDAVNFSIRRTRDWLLYQK